MTPGQDTHHRLGLLVRASVEDIALFRGRDVFEQEDATAGFAVAHTAETVRDASL